MLKVRTFFRKHILWVGLVAVVVPLLSILAVQYNSLKKLEKTSSVADKMWMKNYLSDVSKEVKFFYHTNAEQVLNVPAYSVSAENLHKVRNHFGKCEVEGSKRLFIVAFDEGGGSQTLFFDPRAQAQLVEATPAEVRAANIVAAPYKMLSQEGTAVAGAKISEDLRDPQNRVIFKPITDEWARVVGVAGMILDTEFFREKFLPRVIAATLPKFFPDEARDNVIVTVYDSEQKLVHATQALKGQNDEIATNLPFFYDYRLGIRSRHMTPEQWARWNFNFNLTLSLLMTLVLVSGIVLALRMASREMHLSQMKTDFVSNVSHELRTPLSSIRVFGEFMKLGRVRDPEKMREYGEHIETESRRLTQLINNILDFSKIESGRKTYRVEQVCVEELIAEVLKTCEVRLRQNDFAIVYEPSSQPLPAAFIDRDAIEQALMNLLDNAVKYSESAEVREVVVRAGYGGGLIRISVTDHGVGIPASEQGKIFEKFYRVSTGLVHDVKGSGLGLSLVKHIVEAHRGRVTVESEPGRGSTFTILLPAAGGAAGQEETPQPTDAIGGEQPLNLGYKH
ncbi:MAG TPA: HAMP domain-containing sensor histidine kinase [Pyrinomonadaceae bacterium]